MLSQWTVRYLELKRFHWIRGGRRPCRPRQSKGVDVRFGGLALRSLENSSRKFFTHSCQLSFAHIVFRVRR